MSTMIIGVMQGEFQVELLRIGDQVTALPSQLQSRVKKYIVQKRS